MVGQRYLSVLRRFLYCIFVVFVRRYFICGLCLVTVCSSSLFRLVPLHRTLCFDPRNSHIYFPSC